MYICHSTYQWLNTRRWVKYKSMFGAAGCVSPPLSSVTASELDVVPELLHATSKKNGSRGVAVDGDPTLTVDWRQVSDRVTAQWIPGVRPTAGLLGLSESKANSHLATATDRALGSDGDIASGAKPLLRRGVGARAERIQSGEDSIRAILHRREI